MNCEDAAPLLGAYSLSALSSEEMAAVREHLALCRLHDETLAGLQVVVDRLPLAAEERQPRPELRARLLEAFDAEVAPAAGRGAARTWRWLPSLRPARAYLAAAALLLLAAVALSAWNVALQVGDGGEGTLVAEFGDGAGDSQLVYLKDDAIAVLRLDLPDPPAGRVYQAWGIFGADAVSLGVVRNRGLTAVSADLSGASAVAVTVEPAGGSPSPTTDPLAVARLD